MKIKINFDEPIINKEIVLDIQTSDLDDFYIVASDFDKTNLFFMLLVSIHYYESMNDTIRAAHLNYLAAYYLFVPLTPPGSLHLALYHINKAISLNHISKYDELHTLIKNSK